MEQMKGSPVLFVVLKCNHGGKLAVLQLHSHKSPLPNKPLKSIRLLGQESAESMIKASVYISIIPMYTHDKDIITESLRAPIFICVLNEKNSKNTSRKEKERESKGGREVSSGEDGASSKTSF